MDFFYGFFVWICIWILVGSLAYLFFFCVESLFGLVVVLNRGKICIEKMLGFRGDAVRFFFNPCFCFGYNLVITHPN